MKIFIGLLVVFCSWSVLASTSVVSCPPTSGNGGWVATWIETYNGNAVKCFYNNGDGDVYWAGNIMPQTPESWVMGLTDKCGVAWGAKDTQSCSMILTVSPSVNK